MSFDEALRYLLSLGHETLAMKLGLDAVSRLLARLGDPQKSFDAVQLAGTNGKGSTAAMLDAVCRSAGVRTGLYTSPHLVSVTERVRIDGRDIAREQFAAAASRVRAEAEALARETGARPTFFEQVTTVALVAFRDAGVRLAILETGLGGRLDATTAVGAPVVCLTPVGLDHQQYLGTTLAEIAAEKAAVIRAGITEAAVVARQTREAAEVIERRAAECGVTPHYATEDISFEDISFAGACDAGRIRATFRTERDVYQNVCLALRGRHQAENAAAAIGLAEVLAGRGYAISRAHVVEGLERAAHPGRLELVEGSPPLLLDGAHNAEGARALRAYLEELGLAPVTLVFGAMRDKDLKEIGAALFPAAHRLILTRAENARAGAPEDLICAIPPRHDLSTIALAPRAADALVLARTLTPPEGLICVSGSLYLVGEVKRLLGENGLAET